MSNLCCQKCELHELVILQYFARKMSNSAFLLFVSAGVPLAIRPLERTVSDTQSVMVPLGWYINPLRASLHKVIRPATARTRGKELVVKSRLPVEGFDQFLRPLEGCGTFGLVCAPLTHSR